MLDAYTAGLLSGQEDKSFRGLIIALSDAIREGVHAVKERHDSDRAGDAPPTEEDAAKTLDADCHMIDPDKARQSLSDATHRQEQQDH